MTFYIKNMENTNKNNILNKNISNFNKSTGSFKNATHNKSPLKVKRRPAAPQFETNLGADNETTHIPPLAPGDIRILHLGGVEEIGRNMSMIEYMDSIVIIDCGVQFTESHTPGIDFILPNTKYLEEKKDKIKGMIITHGHLDHIGAIPYIMPRIGNPTIYSRNFTSLMIRKRQEEFPYLEALNINIVEKTDTITLGDLKVRFFGVSHAIPDSMGVIVETPWGDVVHTGRLRLSSGEEIINNQDTETFKDFENRNTILLMSGSAYGETEGYSISISDIENQISNIIRKGDGRIFFNAYSTQIEKIACIFRLANDMGKKVVIDNKAFKKNVSAAIESNVISQSIFDKVYMPLESLTEDNKNDKNYIIITSAEDDDEFSTLLRISSSSHKYWTLNETDTVVMGNTQVMGSERKVQNLKDKLSRLGAHVVHMRTSDYNTAGYAYAGELSYMHRKIQPKFFIPVHGYHYMLRVHADMARKGLAIDESSVIVPETGTIVEIKNQGTKIVTLREKAASDLIVVDGTSVGKVQEVVLRDRQMLGEDGMFVVIGIIDSHTHTLKKSPDIISRGFVYLKESQELLFQARGLCKKTIEDYLERHKNYDIDELRAEISDVISKFLGQKTAKKPSIIPVVISV